MIEKLLPSEVWSQVYFGNTLGAYLDAFLLFVILVIVFYLLQRLALKRLHRMSKKTKTDIDDALVDIIGSIRPPVYYFLALYIAGHRLVLGEVVENIIYATFVIMFVYQIISSLQIFVNYIAIKIIGKEASEDEHLRSAVRMLSTIAKVVLWCFGLVMILSNLGINVSSLIAGMGITGIAIAIALQGVLSDLFASFSIYFDKPFKVGDLIKTKEHTGTVEKIGIKTTRIRSVDGEEVIISNTDLTEKRVENYRRMEERRIKFGVGVIYETPTNQLKKIPQMITDIIDRTSGARIDRVHFKEFNDSSLDFEVVYYVESKAFPDYMDRQQEINYAIREKFEAENIEMAYPTRTLYTKNV